MITWLQYKFVKSYYLLVLYSTQESVRRESLKIYLVHEIVCLVYIIVVFAINSFIRKILVFSNL